MKTTLVLCVLAMVLTLAFGSDHGDSHGAAAGGHGDAGGHGSASGGHGDDGHGSGGHDGGHGSSATTLQLCSTLFSFVVLGALNKLW